MYFKLCIDGITVHNNMNTYVKTVCVLTENSDFKIYTLSMLNYKWG